MKLINYIEEQQSKIKANVVLDSRGPNNVRLLTIAFDLWKPLVAEFNTHRVFTRNSASSRAIPLNKMIEKIMKDDFVPVFKRNKSGMQGDEYLPYEEQIEAADAWRVRRDDTIRFVQEFGGDYKVHKQWVNRLLEPYMLTKILASSTEWMNFFALRNHKDAQDEIRWSAEAIFKVARTSSSNDVYEGQRHLPYVTDSVDEKQCYELSGRISKMTPQQIDDEFGIGLTDSSTYLSKVEALKFGYGSALCYISAGRCATVSYDNLGEGLDPVKDLKRGVKMLEYGHFSPLEHQATALDRTSNTGTGMLVNINKIPRGITTNDMYSGNFRGWKQFRKSIPGESIFTRGEE